MEAFFFEDFFVSDLFSAASFGFIAGSSFFNSGARNFSSGVLAKINVNKKNQVDLQGAGGNAGVSLGAFFF